MRSGELARLSGISTDTLRHYERLGLLPKPPRTAGGYRDYPPASVDRVGLLRRALKIGFSLPELAAILKLRDRGQVPCHEARKIAALKLKEVQSRIDDLVAMESELRAILKDWDRRLSRAKGKPARLLETLPELPRGGASSFPPVKRRSKK
jgi:DNA-binding transcriptional MerR regulator